MTMENLQAQINVMSEEMQTLRVEIVQIKSTHATMHQEAVNAKFGLGR